jgi:hypothetical protein
MEFPRAARNGIIYVLLILAFGVAVPASKGVGFFDPTLLAAYACLGTVFAGPLAAQKFQNRPASFFQALGWIAKAVSIGELLTIAMLACGAATVFFTSPIFFPPDLQNLGYALLLGCAASLALASLAAWVATEFSATVARMTLRLIFLGLLALFYLHAQWLPDVAARGILISLMAAATFAMLLRRNLAQPRDQPRDQPRGQPPDPQPAGPKSA